MAEEQGSTRVDFKVTQRAVLYNTATQKFCIAKAANKDGTFYKKYGPWDLFGGHIEADEIVPADAIQRELLEESGVEAELVEVLSAIDFTGYGRGADKDARRILIGYLALCDTEEITLSDEHSEYAWLTADEIKDHKKVKQWIKDYVAEAVQRLSQREAHEKMLRTLAEFDNYKKRSAENQKDFAQYASQNVISEMLPVLDNFHAATEHIPADQADNSWVTGIMYIQQQMEKVFEDNDVTEIAVKEGDVFDPATMEALESEKSQDDSDQPKKDATQEQRVTKVVQKGYKIKEKVLRPARVTVG